MWKVIIADDEKLICRLVQTLVNWESMGLEIVGTAENGLEALDLIKEYEPNILITDIRMPGCDGLELIKKARQIKKDIEIIIISGYAHFEYAQTAIAYGVGNYILKPIKQDELIETLQKIIKKLEDRNSEGINGGHQNNQNDLKRLRESLITDLLKGNREFTSTELEQNYHFNVKQGILQAFVLKIDFDTEKTGENAFAIIKQKAEEIFHSTVSTVCKESVFGFQGVTGYGVLNYPTENRDDIRRCLREFLNQLEANKNLFGKVEFSIGIGKTATDAAQLNMSMGDARQAVKERLLEGCGRMYESVPVRSGMQKQVLLERYIKMAEHAIEVMDEAEITTAGESLKNAVTSVPHICGREILEIVLDAGKLFVLRTGSRETESAQQEFEFRCRQCSKVESLFAELNSLQTNMIREIKNLHEREATKPIRIAKKYIMDHYEKNITLDEVCEMVGFSATYFSVMFKKETGEGFAKYLTRVRMDRAKELLRDTNIPVSEICERVGYADRKHFTHTFRKATGLNPAEFRRLYG